MRSQGSGKAVALVALLALACASLRAQPAPTAPPEAKEARPVARVPFEMNGNSLFLPVSVNGSKPLWFVLDTGAGVCVMNTTVAESLGLKTNKGGQMRGAGGRVESARLGDATLDVGGARLQGVGISVIPLVSLENNMGRALDGILGYEFFRRYVVAIDYEAGLLDAYEPADFDYRGRGEVLPLTFHDNHPYVRAKVTLAGREPLEGEFIIDAGASLSLVLLPSFIEANRLRETLPTTIVTKGRGVGGEVVMPLGRVASLQLGGLTLQRPVTAFPASGHFGRAGKAGNIGTGILRRFRVIFDYTRRRVILEPAKNFADPFEIDMSGLQLTSEAPAFKVVRVLGVLPGSPAEEAGFREGDEIVTFDGRPASEYRLAALRELLRKPEARYTLRIRRGAETVTLELKTRRLI